MRSTSAGSASTSARRLRRPAATCGASRSRVAAASGAAVSRGAVGEQDLRRDDGVVGVLDHPAAHAAGVVGEDPAHHAAVDGRRVGPDAAPERLEEAVHLRADHAGLHADARPAVHGLDALPRPRQDHQDAVGDGLAGQAGPRGPEGDRHAQVAAHLHHAPHLFHVQGMDHRPRQQVVEARVAGVGHQVDGPGLHPGRLGDGIPETGVQGLGLRRGGARGHRNQVRTVHAASDQKTSGKRTSISSEATRPTTRP